jgi:hypothetical protein
MDVNRIESLSNIYGNQLSKAMEDVSSIANDQEHRTISDKLSAILYRLREAKSRLIKPIMKKRYIRDTDVINSKVINDTASEIKQDVDILFDETKLVGQGATLNFNFTVSERKRIENKIKKLGEMVNDYVVTSTNTISKNITIQDSFNSLEKIDFEKTLGEQANVDTENGIVTLAITGAVDQLQLYKDSVKFTAEGKDGFGYPSNFGIIKEIAKKDNETAIDLVSYQKTFVDYEMEYDTDPHLDPYEMIDGNPNTWYEFQAINFPEELKASPCNYWGLEFTNGKAIYAGEKNKDRLEMTLNITLPQIVELNWLRINPYFCFDVQQNQAENYGLKIKAVYVSDDSTNYVKVSDREEILFESSLNAPDEFIDRQKYTGQYVLSFPSRRTKKIKIVFENTKPYDTKIGHVWYEKKYVEVKTHRVLGIISWTTQSEQKTKRVKGPNIPEEIYITNKFRERYAALNKHTDKYGIGFKIHNYLTAAAAGIFYYNNLREKTVEEPIPHVEAFDGWRWAIAIRDINAMSNEYAEYSSFTSINYELNNPISEVSLEVKETIPKEFYIYDLSKTNEWIKYYMSFDNGTTWHRIAPLSHNTEHDFVPKIISVNSGISKEQQNPDKTYVDYDHDVKNVMIKVELYRPKDSIGTATPVLHNYTIRVAPKDEREVL